MPSIGVSSSKPRVSTTKAGPLPPSDRVTEARGEVKLRGELAAVGEDLTVLVVDLVNDHRLLRRLNDLERLGKQGKHGPAVAVVADIFDAPSLLPPLERRLARGCHKLLTRFGVEQGVQSVFVDCEDLHADVGLFIGGGPIKFLHLFEAEGLVQLQTPVRSGLPLVARGAGAERLGLPSFIGVPAGM